MGFCRIVIFAQVCFLTVIVLQFQHGNGHMIGRNPHHRGETLDPQGKYQLEWLVDWSSKRITFNVTVETRGYVGFGLSRNGKMTGADIVIGRVKRNGEVYFSDRHAVGQQEPELDPSQDWKLHTAWESSTHTCLSFSRDFDTCDPQDYPITNNKVSVIWAYGERDDDITYHFRNRGVFNVYLLDPDHTPEMVRDPITQAPTIVDNEMRAETKLWTINRRIRIPSNDTSYLCTMHKPPALGRKHHVVGYNTRFANKESERHSHHIILYRCVAPPSVGSARATFERFLGLQNMQTCYISFVPSGPMPTQYCTEMYQGWAVGMRTYFTPPHVGFPLAESPDEYYMLQVHYDNPGRRSDITVDLSIELFYTDKLRKNDGAVMIVGHMTPGMPASMLVPPSTPRHRVYGLTVTVFGFALHSHNSGRELRLHQFRGRRELPWLGSDDNYAFNFQQIRAMREERKYMPGDQLSMNCVFDSLWANGTVVGGFSTRQEMCLGFLLYYTRIEDYAFCRSEIQSEESRMRFLGVANATWYEPQLEYVVETPPSLSGLTISQVSDNHVDWNLEKREELQRFHLHFPHVGSCTKQIHRWRGDGEDDYNVPTNYPYEARAYRPEQTCSFRH